MEFGSELMKQGRPDPFEEDGNRASKMGKRGDNKQQILSFSSSRSDEPQNVGFLSPQHVRLSPTFSAGFGFGNTHRSFAGFRGSFTPAQWIELEHQAMIYKYFTANVPVPSNLLNPIRKAIQSAGFPGFSIGSSPFHSYGWGSFHLGFSGNTDPEPGRCRRTDGKKWRCSRDAAPDLKYCEKHIKRGRLRSRKPVEGQIGQVASGAATTKVVPPMPVSISSLVASGDGAPNSIGVAKHQIKDLQPAGATNNYTDSIAKRPNDQLGLSMMPPTINQESKDSRYSIPKQHISFDKSSVSAFGIISNDSLLNPSQRNSYPDCKSYNSFLVDFDTQQNQNESQHSPIPWPKEPKSDWTQLSKSIPNQERVVNLPLRLSHELDQTQMGLGTETILVELSNQQNARTPMTWGNQISVTGPLGEVLATNSSSAIDEGERWNGCPQFGCSTGIIQ